MLNDNFEKLKYDVVNKLIENNITISTAESATAGAISSNICDVPGASKILSVSYVTYSNDKKVEVLKVNKNIIDKYGVVSKETALDMSLKLFNLTHSSICVSVTGNFGPDVLDNKEVGLIYIGIYYKNKNYSYQLNFDGERSEIKQKTIYKTFELLNDLLNLEN